MSKNENVISLEERRRQAAQGAKSDPGAIPAKTEAPIGENKTPETKGLEHPVPGRLIWLHCPACGTLEYTELAMGGGRVHNVCGTQVVEAEVELDLRAEHTISRINLERLNILENLLAEQRRKFEEYLQRISLAAGKSLEEYPFSEEILERLPIAEVDAFGLLISRFFHQVEGFFPDGKILPARDKTPAGETAAPSSPEDGAPKPTND